jgi:23S rRNA pseudouridine1911/1915/1917 synthase
MSGNAIQWDVTIQPEEAGERLDRVLAQKAATSPPEGAELLSRARVQALIKAGAVLRIGADRGAEPASSKLNVKAGETYRLELSAPKPATPLGEDIALTVVHEDRDVIVIDKPAGLVVHPAAGHETGTLVNALIAHCGDSLSGIGGVKRPGIVHRLDKDTSGLLVVAKNDAAHKSLSEQFQSHGADGRLVRRYLALVWGGPQRPAGSIQAALARSKHQRTRIVVVREESGRHAVTHFETAERYLIDAKGRPLASLLHLALETGRTHQIRVHMAHAGHPVMGDATYGSSHAASARKLSESTAAALKVLGRQALHAAELGFEHPRSGKVLHFQSPLPSDMAALRTALAAG